MVKFQYVEDEQVSIPKSPIDKTKQPKIIKPKSVKITGDKTLNKNEIIEYITQKIKNNPKIYTLDFLRGQKQIYDALFEIRK